MAGRTFMDKLRSFFGFPPREPETTGPPPLPSPDAAAAASPTALDLDDRLPATALKKVKEIRTLLAELEQRTEARFLFEEKLEIQRLKATHLPRLLQSYVDIPPEHRGEIFRETGHSASYLLSERLDRILHRLREMSRQLARGNLNAFAENIRFVDTQYGGSPSPFD